MTTTPPLHLSPSQSLCASHTESFANMMLTVHSQISVPHVEIVAPKHVKLVVRESNYFCYKLHYIGYEKINVNKIIFSFATINFIFLFLIFTIKTYVKIYRRIFWNS
jgi:hypothetical protein